MNRRGFLRRLGIGVAVAPMVPALLSQPVKADEPTMYAPEKPAPLSASCSAGFLTPSEVRHAHGMDHTHSIEPYPMHSHTHGVPIGTISAFADGSGVRYYIVTDRGWMPCDGRHLMNVEHPRLREVIGNKYGQHEFFKFSSFLLPNLDQHGRPV